LPIPFPSTERFSIFNPVSLPRPAPSPNSQNQIPPAISFLSPAHTGKKKRKKSHRFPSPSPNYHPFVLGLRLLYLRRAHGRLRPPRPRRCLVISPSPCPVAPISVKIYCLRGGGGTFWREYHGRCASGISSRRLCGWEWRGRASCFGSSGGAVGFEDRAFDGMAATVCPLPWDADPTGAHLGNM
jgi:hypothetical protein